MTQQEVAAKRIAERFLKITEDIPQKLSADLYFKGQFGDLFRLRGETVADLRALAEYVRDKQARDA